MHRPFAPLRVTLWKTAGNGLAASSLDKYRATIESSGLRKAGSASARVRLITHVSPKEGRTWGTPALRRKTSLHFAVTPLRSKMRCGGPATVARSRIIPLLFRY